MSDIVLFSLYRSVVCSANTLCGDLHSCVLFEQKKLKRAVIAKRNNKTKFKQKNKIKSFFSLFYSANSKINIRNILFSSNGRKEARRKEKKNT